MNSPGSIDAATIRNTVNFKDLLQPVASAYIQTSNGEAENGLLVLYPTVDRLEGDVYVKSGILRGCDIFIVKVSPWFRSNVTSKSPQGGFIAVFDTNTGHTIAILNDDHYLSDIRTAAAGALVAKLLAPSTAEHATVVGTGTQAYWQAQALHEAIPLKRLTIAGRTSHHAQQLVSELEPLLPKVSIVATTHIERAVREADVIVTATSSREPIIAGSWLRPGQHLTSVGADDPSKCELDQETLLRSKVFVDERATAERNGNVCRAINMNRYRIESIAGEIGQILNGSIAGRTNNNEITIASLVGIGALDVAAAATTINMLEQ
jgi:ornithine cyclodeaminase/alanine dehydrogenase-like protein (mu-crystallin family)